MKEPIRDEALFNKMMSLSAQELLIKLQIAAAGKATKGICNVLMLAYRAKCEKDLEEALRGLDPDWVSQILK